MPVRKAWTVRKVLLRVTTVAGTWRFTLLHLISSLYFILFRNKEKIYALPKRSVRSVSIVILLDVVKSTEYDTRWIVLFSAFILSGQFMQIVSNVNVIDRFSVYQSHITENLNSSSHWLNINKKELNASFY